MKTENIEMVEQSPTERIEALVLYMATEVNARSFNGLVAAIQPPKHFVGTPNKSDLERYAIAGTSDGACFSMTPDENWHETVKKTKRHVVFANSFAALRLSPLRSNPVFVNVLRMAMPYTTLRRSLVLEMLSSDETKGADARVGYAAAVPTTAGYKVFLGPGKDSESRQRSENEIFMMINMIVSLSFQRQFEWHTQISYNDGPSVSFATDPIGVREVFALRDLGESKRRAALLHWVSAHWRQKRDGDLTEVRKHLRGSRHFKWNGFEVKVTPPASEVLTLTS